MNIKDYIELYNKNKTLIAFALGDLFVLLFLRQCNHISTLKEDVKIANENANREYNNYLASNDSVKTLKLENGNMVSTIRGYEFDVANLKDSERVLTSKYQKQLGLNKKLEGVNSLLMADLEVKDSIILTLSQTKIDSLTTMVEFASNDDFGNGNTRTVKGGLYIKRDPLTFDFLAYDPTLTIDQKIKLSAAILEENGVQQLRISTQYPGLTITDIENINLINTKLNARREKSAGWSIGPSIGVGFTLTPGQVISFGPTIGLSAVWSPKWLRF